MIQGTPEQVIEFMAAFAQARAEFEPIGRDREGQKGNQRFRYAPLATLQASTGPALANHGFGCAQPLEVKLTEEGESVATVTTLLMHRGGGCMASAVSFQPCADLKDFGSQTTYYRRYSYQAALCIDAGDDADEIPTPIASGHKAQKPGPRFTGPASGAAGSKTTDSTAAGKSGDRGNAEYPDTALTEQVEGETESPAMTTKTSTRIHELFVQLKMRAPEALAITQDVTGRKPDGLRQPGGEALAIKLVDALRAKLDEQGGASG